MTRAEKFILGLTSVALVVYAIATLAYIGMIILNY